MKTARIIQSIGYFALFLGSCFNLVNAIAEREIFPRFVTLPLLAIALVGLACAIVILGKNKRKK